MFDRGVIILQYPFDKRHKKMYNSTERGTKVGICGAALHPDYSHIRLDLSLSTNQGYGY